MGKKSVKNRYGVQVGDIFYQHRCTEDDSYYYFYQVTALRGETQAVVRQIEKRTVAFDGDYEEVVPIPDAWITEQLLIRKVHSGSDTYRARINIYDALYGSAYLDNLNDKSMYLEYYGCPCLSYWFGKYNPETAAQLNLKKGSGVYAVDPSFKGIRDDCAAVIRYSDGREENVIIKELLHYEAL